MTRIADALGQTFSSGGFDERAKFVATVMLDNIRSGDTQIKHRMLWLIVSAGLIELLGRSAVTGMTFFGLSLREFAAVHKVAPAILAYFYFSLCALIVYVKFAQDAYDALIRSCFEALWLQDVELHMRPVYDMRVFALLMSEYKEKHNRLLRYSVGSLFALPILLAPIYIGYSYVILFMTFGPTDLLVIASAATSLFLVAQGLLVLHLDTSDDNEADFSSTNAS
jgi:hypothetical protein